MTDVRWVQVASRGLQTDFGLHRSLACAVATKLLEREKARGGEIGDPPGVVSDHMRWEDERLVDPDDYT